MLSQIKATELTSYIINQIGEKLKLITAIIKPFKLEEVRESLDKIGITGMTITEVKDLGKESYTELYRGAEYVIDFLPKIKVEIAVSIDQLRKLLM